MKRIIIHVVFFLCFCSQWALAQNKSGNTWMFGGPWSVRCVFADTSKPLVIPQYNNPFTYSMHGHSNICDSATGKLLFSCNGMILFDSNAAKMDNGDSLVPQKIYKHNPFPQGLTTQNSIILPKGSNGLYYVIIPTVTDSLYDVVQLGSDRAPFDLILYHIVDSNANNGWGKFISKNNVLLNNVEMHKIGMMACRHANGRDWWLLKQGRYDTNEVYRFLVKPDTIEGPWIQTFSAPHYSPRDLTGQSAFSPDGKKFAFVHALTQQLFMADFDRCTGELLNPKLYNVPIDTTPSTDPKYKYDSVFNGVCFSSNNQFVYISKRWNQYQFEYDEPDSSLAWYHVFQGPDTSMQKFQAYSSLHRGIDGRIYIGNIGGQHKQMSVIDKPDIKGPGCSFCRKCFRLDDTTQMGFGAPPDLPDFNLGPQPGPCWPLGSSEHVALRTELEVYPNPSSTVFYIKNKQGKRKELYTMLGELLYATVKDEIDVRGGAKGMYYLRCEGITKKVIVE